MSVEALLSDDWMRGNVRVLWRRSHDAYVEYNNGREAVLNPAPDAELKIEPLVLTHDAARALLTSLLRHYDGGEDTRSLRRDYDAERKRVDQFIAHLTAGSA